MVGHDPFILANDQPFFYGSWRLQVLERLFPSYPVTQQMEHATFSGSGEKTSAFFLP